jgi:hypothetical protein
MPVRFSVWIHSSRQMLAAYIEVGDILMRNILMLIAVALITIAMSATAFAKYVAAGAVNSNRIQNPRL